jgi:hypothetical protein
MAGANRFGDLTHWDKTQQPAGSPDGGWYPPGQDWYIGTDDNGYWNRVLQSARDRFGDPNIHYSTDSPREDRSLTFGDGTRLPTDQTIVYHDAASKRNWIQNDNGTVTPADANFKPTGAELNPAGHRLMPDGKYAALDARGDQIAPLAPSLPNPTHGWHSGPNNVQTPLNANGDYFELDPATGIHKYFDRNGHPISKAQYDGAAPTSAPPGAPRGTAPLPTDEQQSGRTADAVKKLQGDLKRRYNDLSSAEEQLAEVMLNARATTADGQKQLNDIQKKIVEAVNNPALSLDTPAGEAAFLKFLRGQVAAIGDVLKSGSLKAEDQAKAISALSHLYTVDQGTQNTDTPPPTAGQTNDPGPGSAAPSAPPSSVDPSLTDPALTDPGLGPQMPMPDPSLSDLGLGSPMGPDPLSSLASMLPALGGVSPLGGGGSPLDGLSGLAGAASPLAGLASQLGDQASHPDGGSKGSHADDKKSDTDTSDTKDNKDSQPATQPGQQQPVQPGQQPPTPEPAGAPGQGAPPAAPAAAAAPASTTVALPDGSSANAKSPALASAVKSYLAGTPLDSAYRQANIELPPPGTPVTNPVDPSQLSTGYLGMFKDHYVVALSAAKALKDGQVVSLASAAAGPDFLGWIDPSTMVAGQQPAATPTASPPALGAAPSVAPLAAVSGPTG